ncbi:MAG: helix-turn-helix domain-containing protein [Sulfurimonas sp.]|nr:helix-turn-helix domain-containing protein [Sulfurimonas sp.]
MLEFHKAVSRNVKRIRLEKNRTQLDLSLSIGMKSASFFGNAENDCKNGKHFSVEHLYKIAKELGVSIKDFC